MWSTAAGISITLKVPFPTALVSAFMVKGCLVPSPKTAYTSANGNTLNCSSPCSVGSSTEVAVSTRAFFTSVPLIAMLDCPSQGFFALYGITEESLTVQLQTTGSPFSLVAVTVTFSFQMTLSLSVVSVSLGVVTPPASTVTAA